MKTILNLKQYVILLVTAFAMASCLGRYDPDLRVGGIGYVIQQHIITKNEDSVLLGYFHH